MSGIPHLWVQACTGRLQDFHYVMILYLSPAACSGLGAATQSFQGHPDILEHAGEEKKAAGEGAERA